MRTFDKVLWGMGLTGVGLAFLATILSPTLPPKPVAAATQPVPPAAQPGDGYDFERARRDAAREAAFNCAVLRDAVNDARAAGANAQRYGWHESYSQGMEMQRAEEALRKCDR